LFVITEVDAAESAAAVMNLRRFMVLSSQSVKERESVLGRRF
jgi:hypothetical protein